MRNGSKAMCAPGWKRILRSMPSSKMPGVASTTSSTPGTHPRAVSTILPAFGLAVPFGRTSAEIMNANLELPHVSRRLLFSYFQNSVPEQQALQIEEHLADCHDCTSLARQVRGFVAFWKQCSPPVPDLSPPLAPLARSTLLTAISERLRAAWHRLNFGLPRTAFDLQNETQVEGPLVLGVAIVAVVIALPLLLSTFNERRQPAPHAAAALTLDRADSPSANPTRCTKSPQVLEKLSPDSKALRDLFANSSTTDAKPTESAEAAPEAPPQPRMHQLREDLDELGSRVREVVQVL